MITVHTFDSEMISSGSVSVDEMAPIPQRCTLLAPPRTKGTQVARFNGANWEVLPERPAAKAPVPFKVTRSQARRALLLRGLFDQVQPIIDAIPDPIERGMAQIMWDDALDFERHSPIVAMIGQALGLDEAALDDLFISAASLP